MKIALISDTHVRHDWIAVPDADMVIHAGDFSGRGRLEETTVFLKWFTELPHTHKVLIAGNHDFIAEKDPELFRTLIPDTVHYLENSAIEIEGLKIWGSPITPWFYNWAFNRNRGAEILPYWQAIPSETDILITHGPPAGILDIVDDGTRVGCEDLRNEIRRVQPRLHVFGHIHEAYGQIEEEGTLFVNASSVNLRYNPVNEPILITLD